MYQKYWDFLYIQFVFMINKGFLPFVARNKLGNREFTESDLNLFRVICCLKNSGMQIKDIKGYIDLCMEGAETIDPRRDLLVEHRKKIVKQIDSLKEKLELVDVKIERYEAPNAVELINEERRKAYEEKCENKLI